MARNTDTRREWIAKLIRECEFIARWVPEWKVERRSGGATVTTPDGVTITIPATSPYRTAPVGLLAELRKHGYDQGKTSATIREAKAEAGAPDIREAHERDTATIRAQAGIKVAQPSIADLMTPHPTLRVWERVEITPAMADKLLTLNTGNRPPSRVDVNNFCGILARGEWIYTHQGIGISRDGVLLDGQTRLQAIEKSGIPAPVQVTVGLESRAFDVMDTQRRRSAAQLFGARGEASALHLQALIRLVYAYDHQDPRDRISRLSNLQITSIFDEDPESWREAVRLGFALALPTRAGKTAAATTAYLLRRDVGPADPGVLDYLDKVRSGEMMTRDEPPMALRRWIINSRTMQGSVNAAIELGIWLKAWKDFSRGERPKGGYKLRDDEGFPVVYVP